MIGPLKGEVIVNRRFFIAGAGTLLGATHAWADPGGLPDLGGRGPCIPDLLDLNGDDTVDRWDVVVGLNKATAAYNAATFMGSGIFLGILGAGGVGFTGGPDPSDLAWAGVGIIGAALAYTGSVSWALAKDPAKPTYQYVVDPYPLDPALLKDFAAMDSRVQSFLVAWAPYLANLGALVDELELGRAAFEAADEEWIQIHLDQIGVLSSADIALGETLVDLWDDVEDLLVELEGSLTDFDGGQTIDANDPALWACIAGVGDWVEPAISEGGRIEAHPDELADATDAVMGLSIGDALDEAQLLMKQANGAIHSKAELFHPIAVCTL